MTSPDHTPRVVCAIDRSRSATERARAIGYARLQARLVHRHVLAADIDDAERSAAWVALLTAEADAGHPLPADWQYWQIGAPALLAWIETAMTGLEASA